MPTIHLSVLFGDHDDALSEIEVNMLKRVFEMFGGNRPASPISEGGDLTRMCAERVHKFSSQYGGEKSRGYTVSNIAGESSKYPNYGDFSEACVMVCSLGNLCIYAVRGWMGGMFCCFKYRKTF